MGLTLARIGAHRNASCDRVWRHIIDAGQWPSGYPNSKDVRILGGDPVLRDGTVFRWTTWRSRMECN
jgi:hypothetical protein